VWRAAAEEKMSANGLVQELRDGAGFWLPDSLLDRHLDQLGPRGVLVYLLLARSPSLAAYPCLAELARKSGLSRPKVAQLLRDLKHLGLLNQHDLTNLLGDRT
jgi:DNA-binding MarR family transcriptional regulator